MTVTLVSCVHHGNSDHFYLIAMTDHRYNTSDGAGELNYNEVRSCRMGCLHLLTFTLCLKSCVSCSLSSCCDILVHRSGLFAANQTDSPTLLTLRAGSSWFQICPSSVQEGCRHAGLQTSVVPCHGQLCTAAACLVFILLTRPDHTTHATRFMLLQSRFSQVDVAAGRQSTERLLRFMSQGAYFSRQSTEKVEVGCGV